MLRKHPRQNEAASLLAEGFSVESRYRKLLFFFKAAFLLPSFNSAAATAEEFTPPPLDSIPLDNCQPISVLDPGDPLTPTSVIVRVRLDFAGSILGKGPPPQTTCYVQFQDPDNPVQQVVASCPKSNPLHPRVCD
ncbi:hypothetical protein STEG23_008859 [Scotinomys teguina]